MVKMVRNTNNIFIGGIDEAGRGPLAGPVSVALMIAPRGFRFWHPRLGKIRDVKKMTPRMRRMWYDYLSSHPQLSWTHAYVTSRVIDRVNIARAVDRGVRRLVARTKTKPNFVFLDGSLALPDTIPHKVVIRGDETIPVVSAASVIAKVRRDRYMVRMAKRFPAYDFELHKGYGTKKHVQLLKAFGPSPLHRASFIRSFI